MHRPSRHPPSSVAHLRLAVQGATAASFLGLVAIASLSALPGWLAPWLLLMPLASLVTARSLLWSRRARRPAPAAAGPVATSRRQAARAAPRRRAASRPGRRLLAAVLLR